MLPHTVHNRWIVRRNREDAARIALLCRGELLDIGCGDRPYEDLIRPHVTKYVGFDHPDTQHDRAKVDVWGTATDLPFEDGSFDTVVAFQVLEHVEEPGAMVAEAFRVLRPDGVFIVTTPFMWGVHEAPRDFYRYTEFGLRHLLSTAGFAEIEVEAVSGVWMMLAMRFSYFLEPWSQSRKRPLVLGLQLLAQSLGSRLDRAFRVETDTIGYVTVARVPSSVPPPEQPAGPHA